VSVLAVGTEAGRPIRREDGSLVQDNAGNIVIAGLDTAGLQQLARTGNGVYVRLGTGSEDVEQLIQAISQQRTHTADTDDPRQSEYWIEYGPWLIPLMMLCLLTVFRRGVL
jgi:Ca-activated chloride channel family protein